MSRLQELHPDQQAVLQLVLRRRMPYGDLAGLLGLTAEGVRERALDAIDGLAPDDVPGLALEDRDRIADHLLGQDDGADREATAALLDDHPPARTWAATVAAELEPLGGPVADVPDDVPSADEPVSAAAPAADDPPPATPVASPAASDVGAAFAAVSRDSESARKRPFAGQSPAVLAGGGAALVVVVVLVLWIAGAFDGGDDGSDSASADTPPAATTTAASQATDPAAAQAAAAQFAAALPQTIRFRPPSGAAGPYARVTGTAKPTVSTADASIPVLALTIEHLPAPTAKRRYFVWADKNGADPIFLGQLSDARGAELRFEGLDLKSRQAMTVDPTVYTTFRITRETAKAPTKPGPTVIVGRVIPRS